MTGRKFAQYNRADPAPVVRLIPLRPACFTDPRDWRGYLLDTYRGVLDDEPERQRLIRGEVPFFCADCTVGYRNKMRALGRCHPPALNDPNDRPSPSLGPDFPASGNAGGLSTPSKEVAEVHANRLEPAARAAVSTSAGSGVLGVKTSTPLLGLSPEPPGNARCGSHQAPPVEHIRLAGVREEVARAA